MNISVMFWEKVKKNGTVNHGRYTYTYRKTASGMEYITRTRRADK